MIGSIWLLKVLYGVGCFWPVLDASGRCCLWQGVDVSCHYRMFVAAVALLIFSYITISTYGNDMNNRCYESTMVSLNAHRSGNYF